MALDFPNNPTPGQKFDPGSGTVWEWDGSKWVAVPGGIGEAPEDGKIYGRLDATWAEVTGGGGGGVGSINVKVFTASGTYTPTAGLGFAVIECVGGGGAGGAVAGTDSKNFGGGGGGSGGYSRKTVAASVIGASQVVTVGAGGVAGLNADGLNGGDSSVGTLCLAIGGTGGFWNSIDGGSGNMGGGGWGGSGGAGSGAIGDITASGTPGNGGIWTYDANAALGAGNGGSSYFGGGGAGPAYAQEGAPGTNYGGGGGGALAQASTDNYAGGAGADGVVVITEFLGGGGGGPAAPLTASVAFSFTGKPTATTTIFVPVAIPLIIPVGLTGTIAFLDIPSTGSATFTLHRVDPSNNRTILGTITTAAGQQHQFTLAGPGGSMNAGDAFLMEAPSPADASMADIGITILATRA